MVMPTRTQQFNSDGTPKLDRNGQPVYTDTTPSGRVDSGAALFRDLRQSCASADMAAHTGRTFRSMVRRGAEMTDEDARDIVKESVNLLV